MQMAKLTRADAESAAQNMGIETSIDAVTLTEVRAAFAKALRAAHPDTAEAGKYPVSSEYAADTIATIRAARDMLMEWVTGRPNPNCSLCKGTGHYRTAFSSRPCPRCV